MASGIIQTFGWDASKFAYDRRAALKWTPSSDDVAFAPLLRICAGFQYMVALYPGGRSVPIGREDFPVYRGLNALVGVDIVDIAFGKDFFLALTSNGEVLSYGANQCGQLGQSHINALFSGPFTASPVQTLQSIQACSNFETSDHVPAIVRSLLGRRIVRIACGAQHCMALSDSGDVFAWGDGSSGQLGAANIQLQPTPKLVASLYTALREAAKATAAPANPAAQEAPAAQDLKVPVGADGLVTIKKFRAESEEARRARMKVDTITDISCGAHFSAALTAHGYVYTWGEGRSYQLGTGRCAQRAQPTIVPFATEGLSPFIESIACGASHMLALSGNGEVFTWGLGILGVLGHGYSLHDDFASGEHAGKLKSDGTNAAKAVSAPSIIRSLEGFRISRVVATQHASYLIAATQQLIFRMGRDTPHGDASTASSEDFSDAEVLDSLQPIPMTALTCMPVEHFAANGLSVACLIPTCLNECQPRQVSLFAEPSSPARLTFTGLALLNSGRTPLLRFVITRYFLNENPLAVQAAAAMACKLLIAAEVQGEFVQTNSDPADPVYSIVCAAPDLRACAEEALALSLQNSDALPVWVSASLDGGVQWTDPSPLLCVYGDPVKAVQPSPATVHCAAANTDNMTNTLVKLHFEAGDVVSNSYSSNPYSSARVRVALPVADEAEPREVEVPCAVKISDGAAVAEFTAPDCDVAGHASVKIALNGQNFVPLQLTRALQYVAPAVHFVGPPYTYAIEESQLVIHTSQIDADMCTALKVRFTGPPSSDNQSFTVDATFAVRPPEPEPQPEVALVATEEVAPATDGAPAADASSAPAEAPPAEPAAAEGVPAEVAPEIVAEPVVESKPQYTGIITCKVPLFGVNDPYMLTGSCLLSLSVDGGQVFVPIGAMTFLADRPLLAVAEFPPAAALSGGSKLRLRSSNLDPRQQVSAVFVAPDNEEAVFPALGARVISASSESDWVIEVDAPALGTVAPEQRTMLLRATIDDRLVGQQDVVCFAEPSFEKLDNASGPLQSEAVLSLLGKTLFPSNTIRVRAANEAKALVLDVDASCDGSDAGGGLSAVKFTLPPQEEPVVLSLSVALDGHQFIATKFTYEIK